MSSRILPMEGLEQRDIMFWLPPGGRDNGVWASQWTLLAELDGCDAQPVLSKLADVDVGAYAAPASGAMGRGDGGRRLYVDAMQYNQAVDALMLFLRGKHKREPGEHRPAKRPAATAQATARRRPAAPGTAKRAVQAVLAVAVFALLLAALYQLCANRYAAEPAGGQPGRPSSGQSAVSRDGFGLPAR
jgi:hypothetical protein